MRPDQIAAARAVCEAAPAAPWRASKYDVLVADRWIECEQSDEGHAIAVFIAAARTGWPAALDAVEQLTGERDGLFAIVDAIDAALAKNLDRDGHLHETIKVNPDGSSGVEMERDEIIAEIIDERDDERIGCNILRSERDSACAELALLRPVVEAAKAFRVALKDEDNECVIEHNALMDAVDALLAKEADRG